MDSILCYCYWTYGCEGWDGLICTLRLLTQSTGLETSTAKIMQLNKKVNNLTHWINHIQLCCHVYNTGIRITCLEVMSCTVYPIMQVAASEMLHMWPNFTSVRSSMHCNICI